MKKTIPFLLVLLLMVSGLSMAQTHTFPATDTNNTFTGNNTFAGELITKSTPVIDVRAYGAKGDGSTDNATALQTAINAAVAAHSSLYLPCGTYNTTQMLTVYGLFYPSIRGENAWCTIIAYTGTADVPSVVRIANNASHDQYIEGGEIAALTIQGNTHVTEAALSLYRANGSTFHDLYLGPANATTGACLYVVSGIGNTYSVVNCTVGRGNWGGLAPMNGLVFDGTSSGDMSTTSVIDVPGVAGVHGKALWLTQYSGGFHVRSCQISANGEAAAIDGTVNTFEDCLFEGSTGANSVEVNGQGNILSNAFFSESYPRQLLITAPNLKVQNGYASDIKIIINSTASGVKFEKFSMAGATITDNSDLQDTQIDGVADGGNSGNTAANWPIWKLSPPNANYASSGYGPLVHASGSWAATSGTPRPLFPNVFAIGKAWRAYFYGYIPGDNNQPRMFELTDSANTIASGGTITFAVSAITGKFEMSTTNGGWSGFAGEIYFFPSTQAAGANSSYSAVYTGDIKAATFRGNVIGSTATLNVIGSDNSNNLWLAAGATRNATLTAPGTTYIIGGNAGSGAAFAADGGNSAWRASIAGASDLGVGTVPWRSIYIGTANSVYAQIKCTACTTYRTIELPDANSNTVVPLASPGSDHKWVQYVDSSGVQTRTQPAVGDLSDASSVPTHTGTPTTNRAVCWKTASTLGYCSTAPDGSGACTCN